MDDELLKLECLKMAAEREGLTGAGLTTEAQRLFDFLKGRGQGGLRTETPPDLVGGGIARVVGKDRPDFLNDYKPE